MGGIPREEEQRRNRDDADEEDALGARPCLPEGPGEQEWNHGPEIRAHEEQEADERRAERPPRRGVPAHQDEEARHETEGRERGVALVRVVGDDDALGGEEEGGERPRDVSGEPAGERRGEHQRQQPEADVQPARGEEIRAGELRRA